MKIYPEKLNRDYESSDVNRKIQEAYENMFKVNESSQITVESFLKEMETAIKKSFPNSYININASTNLGSSIHLTFALGKDRSEWENGIIENDVLFHRFMIGYNSFTEGTFIKDKIEAEAIVGGSLTVEPPNSMYALGRVKTGWRKKTATPEKMVKAFENYFKKVKQVLKDNVKNMRPSDLERIGKKIK